ncbi:MAG: FKBP-type peptidyl-prolyl cis-trans isomerase [Methermicoccaceae archaeon]
MTLSKGDFIRIVYTGKLEDGSVFDTTDEEVAKENDLYDEDARYGGNVVVLGAGHLIDGVEEDVLKRDVGYEGEVVVPPEKGFGNRRPELIKSYSKKKFKEEPREGMRINIDGRIGTVTRVVGGRVQVDFNNPLADKYLTYTYKILERIEDDFEKVKGLLALYTKEDFEAELEDKITKIMIPHEVTYDVNWLKVKDWLANQILEHTDMEKVMYIEEYTKE